MLRRLLAATGLALLAALASAQETTLQSIVAGPFEFPIGGTFKVSQENGAYTLTSADEQRRIVVGFFRNPDGRIPIVEGLVRRDWERFAAEEKGEVVRAFNRVDLADGLALFTMATEFKPAEHVQYYVQVAVTDGPQMAALFFEGFGSGAAALEAVEPLVRSVQRRQER
jgi:hypothetical protein